MKRTFQKPYFKYLICLILAVITFGAFAGVAGCSFLVFDDRNYVVDHPAVQHGFSWATIKWAFTTFDCSNWHPLTWFSHILDCQLYGLHPAGHHLTNLGFHIANTILLFFLFHKLTGRLWAPAFAALLFGIHPMHVESVAWVSERKDVLSTFFFLLTLLAYARYAEVHRGRSFIALCGTAQLSGAHKERAHEQVVNPHSAFRIPHSVYYAVALFFCILSLMSKPMVVTLPFVLLLLDFWPLQRFALSTPRPSLAKTVQRLLVEKIPFFVLAALSSLVTLQAQGAAEFQYPLALRLAHVLWAYGWYLLKFVWPVDLSAFYPLNIRDFGMDALAALLVLCIITGFAIKFVRTRPYFLFGWLWFLGMLVPVIGIVQAGGQAYADRYSYLPYIGLLIMIAWGVPDLAGLAVTAHKPSGKVVDESPMTKVAAPPAGRVVPAVICAGAVAVAIACFVRTVQEVGYWKDGITLFGRAVTVDPKNAVAWTFLGGEFLNRHNYQKATDCINRALALKPDFYLAWQFLGELRKKQGDYAGAGAAYKKALAIAFSGEDSVYVCNSYNALGDHLFEGGDYYAAIPVFQNSLDLFPDQPDIQAKLGQCLLQTRQTDQAATAFQTAIELQPDNALAHAGLGMISQSAGADSDAVVEYRKALQGAPDSILTLNNLAWLLATDSDATLRNGPEAVSLAEHACQLTHYEKAFLIGTLAAAYAEAGRFDDAVATAQKAHDVALAHGEKDLAARNEALLKTYKSHQPYRDETAQSKTKN